MTIVKVSVLITVVEHVCFGFGLGLWGFLFVLVELYSLEPSFTGACYLGRRESPYDPETVGINIP